MTHYVHTGTVRDRVASRLHTMTARTRQFYYVDTPTSTLLDGDSICQTLRIICQYNPQPSAEKKKKKNYHISADCPQKVRQ